MGRKVASSDRGAGPYIWRFSGLERVLHAMVIVSFFGLVITGTPLLYSHMPWARTMIRLVGRQEALFLGPRFDGRTAQGPPGHPRHIQVVFWEGSTTPV
jgi:hypothetical protein